MQDVKEMTGVEARAELESLVSQMSASEARAIELCDEHGLSFDNPVGDYGMGGWYTSGQWNASSESC